MAQLKIKILYETFPKNYLFQELTIVLCVIEHFISLRQHEKGSEKICFMFYSDHKINIILYRH